jgi:hypothetical protein
MSTVWNYELDETLTDSLVPVIERLPKRHELLYLTMPTLNNQYTTWNDEGRSIAKKGLIKFLKESYSLHNP